ncbi:MAG: hypothetical protein JEZ06_12040 [Anaerolineaceae bacterium]|nr:hypothetical protein [Anaerolineaceae bacterium]
MKDSQLFSVLSELSAVRIENTRLEKYINEIYKTECDVCGQSVQANTFLWHKNDSQPYAKIIDCPQCNKTFEQKISTNDLLKIKNTGNEKLHKSLAIRSVQFNNDPKLYQRIEEIISIYTPRSLFFLNTILQKIDNNIDSPEDKFILKMLLLNACDEGNMMWPWPSVRSHPRLISQPGTFQEKNLWNSIENSIPSWQFFEEPIPFSIYPDTFDDSKGVCLYKGRLQKLLQFDSSIQFQAVIAAIPRPMQAFWALSAIWSGWLFGEKSVIPLQSALSRKRYDWHWHTSALKTSFAIINQNIRHDLPVFAILSETEIGSLTSGLLSAKLSGFSLSSFSFNQEDETTQICWSQKYVPHKKKYQITEALINEAILNFLITKGEPASLLELYISGYINLLENDGIDFKPNKKVSEFYKESQDKVFAAIQNRTLFSKLASNGSHRILSKWWFNSDETPPFITLSDKLEKTILEYFQIYKTIELKDLLAHLHKTFPGLLSPDSKSILDILKSYAERKHEENNIWKLKKEENNSIREQEIELVYSQLEHIGRLLGFEVNISSDISWRLNEILEYSFGVFYTTCFSHWLSDREQMSISRKKIIILPAARFHLVHQKLQRNQILRELTKEIVFLNFNKIHSISNKRNFSIKDWENLISVGTEQAHFFDLYLKINNVHDQ